MGRLADTRREELFSYLRTLGDDKIDELKHIALKGGGSEIDLTDWTNYAGWFYVLEKAKLLTRPEKRDILEILNGEPFPYVSRIRSRPFESAFLPVEDNRPLPPPRQTTPKSEDESKPEVPSSKRRVVWD